MLVNISIINIGLEPHQLFFLSILVFCATIFNLYMLHMLINILRALWSTAFFTTNDPPGGLIKTGEEPVVTIQICVYNEASVIQRTIDAACQVDWPKDKLHVQILDDSSDQTSDIIETITSSWREKGVNCYRLTRPNRIGYKAGNLQAHGKDVKGEFVALFDADHRCDVQFLQKTIPHFFKKDGSNNNKIGLVGTPWAYYNQHQNLLTEFDTLVLDYAFAVDRVGLSGTNNFFCFNGTGGVWRQAAIDAAGGWKWDTVTEDLDTSILAHMKGYEFVYLRQVPQQLESTGNILAHRKQKHRWTKGRWQIVRKRLINVCKSPNLSFNAKVEIFFHVTTAITNPIALISSLLAPVVAGYGIFTVEILLFAYGFTTFVHILGIVTACLGKECNNGQYTNIWARIVRILYMTPIVMSFSIGMTVFEIAAMIDGILSDDATFHRTAKEGSQRFSLYKNEEDSIVVLESESDDDDDDNKGGEDKGNNKKKSRNNKSFENETLEAIIGILFVIYDWVCVAINIQSETVTQDPVAIFMGIEVPLFASLGFCYMHGLLSYELILAYFKKRQQQSKAFQKKNNDKNHIKVEFISTTDDDKTEIRVEESFAKHNYLDTSNKICIDKTSSETIFLISQ